MKVAKSVSVVALEIKREVYEGALSSWRRAALPVYAAIGGMLVPALIFLQVVGWKLKRLAAGQFQQQRYRVCLRCIELFWQAGSCRIEDILAGACSRR